MSAQDALSRASAEVALRLGVQYAVPAARTLALCALAGRVGHASRLDRLAAVLVAVADAGGDVRDSALDVGSPADQRDRAAHLRAEVRRRCGRGNDWRAQVVPERRRGVRQTWAEAQASDYAHTRWPGRSGAAKRARARWLRVAGVTPPKRIGGAL